MLFDDAQEGAAAGSARAFVPASLGRLALATACGLARCSVREGRVPLFDRPRRYRSGDDWRDCGSQVLVLLT